MTERTLPERLRKEAARGDAKAGEECCNAPWTCCDPKLLLDAADALDAKSALLARIASIIEAVDNRCMAADGPVTPTLQEMTQDEISRIYALAKGKQENWKP